jgi:hypothetical protein
MMKVFNKFSRDTYLCFVVGISFIYIFIIIYMNYYLQIFIRVSRVELLLGYMNLPEYTCELYACTIFLFISKISPKQRAEILSKI